MLGHPRDPYRRVDIFLSSRHVCWKVDSVMIANSTRALLVAETGMPGRWYLPRWDVNPSVLHRTDTRTVCPYKGFAEYFSVTVEGSERADAVWSYPSPLPESARLAGMLSADPTLIQVSVDGHVAPEERFHPRWLNPSLWL